jgi:hypothetical protein
VLTFLGRYLWTTREEIPSGILDRLRDLWVGRVAAARATGDDAEIIPFGWRFASGKFEDAWSLMQLKEALALSRWVEPDEMVIERLAAVANAVPLVAVESLKNLRLEVLPGSFSNLDSTQ